jgi:multiple sugar transport system substrate-binding protein
MRMVRTPILTTVLLAFTLSLGAAFAQDPLVVVASESQAPFFQFVADKFVEQHGYPVQIVSQAYDQTHEVIVTAAAGGSTSFDLPVIDTVYVASYAAIGIVEPLDAYAPQEFFDQHTDSSMDMMTYQGVPYALGGGYNYKYFFYNQRMLEAAGFSEPPATWDELIEMSKVMQEMGIAAYPLAWGWSQAEGLICDYTLLLNAFGGVYQDESGAWTVDTAAARETLQFMYDTIHTHGIAEPASTSLSDREVMSLFLNADVAFVLNWDFGWAWSQDPSRSNVIDDARIGLIPGNAQHGTVSSTTGGGSGPAIMSTSTKKDLAWQFIELYTSPETQMEFLNEMNGQRVTHVSLLDRPELQEEPYRTMFEQQAYAYPRAKITWYPQFSSTLQLEIHRALTGSKSVEQALADAQVRIDRFAQDLGGQ